MAEDSGASRGAPRGLRALLAVALLAAIHAAYSPALEGELQFDDLRSLTGFPGVRDPAALATPQAFFTVSHRALTTLTFAFNYATSGLSVRPYHLVNLALHLATVGLVFALGAALLKRIGWPAPFAAAFLAAALFGLHPLQSQAVAYICQRAEVLASLLYLLGLLLALRPTAAAYAGACVCVLLGWTAKPILATFPAALLLCQFAFRRRDDRPAGRPWIASLPFFALTALFSAQLLHAVSGTGHGGFALPGMAPGRYLLTQSRVVLTYLRLLFWPAGQNVDWDFAPSASLFEPRTLLALAAIAGLLGGAAWLWLRSTRARDEEAGSCARIAAFGVFWFFLLLAPTSSIVPVADVLEEHRVYLAAWGPLFAIAVAADLAWRRLALRRSHAVLAGALASSVLAALGFALHRRSAVWETGVTLWSDAVSKSPRKPRPHMNLGYALAPENPEAALAQFRLADRLDDGTVDRAELLQNTAGALLRLGRSGEALALLEQLAAAAPPSPELATNLAIAYLESGRLDAAEGAASKVARQWPGHAAAWHTLGQVAFARADYAAAARSFERAFALDPEALVSLASLAVAQERLGDRAAACGSWARYGRSPDARAAGTAAAKLAQLDCAPLARNH